MLQMSGVRFFFFSFETLATRKAMLFEVRKNPVIDDSYPKSAAVR